MSCLAEIILSAVCIWKLSFLSGLKNKLLICWFFSERPTPKCYSCRGAGTVTVGLWACELPSETSKWVLVILLF